MATFDTVLVTGAATTVATEIVKRIPKLEKYDHRITAVLISIIASIVAVAQTSNVAYSNYGIVDWITLIVGTVFVATLVYNNLVKSK